MSSPYSINVFVPNGVSDDLKVIKQNNWTGIGIVICEIQVVKGIV